MISSKLLPLVAAGAILLSVAVLPNASAAATVDGATWGAPGAPVQASPGDTARPLSVTIRNQDPVTYTDVVAQLAGSGPLQPAPGGDSASLPGKWAQGDVFVAKFFLNVGADANVSTAYALPLTLTLSYYGQPGTFTTTLSVPVKLTGHPVLVVSASPSTLAANETRDITITVGNAGDGPAGAVTMSVAPAQGSGLALVRTESARALGGLAPGASRTATFTVRAPLSGAAALATTLAYGDAAGNAAQESHTLYFDLQTMDATTPPTRQNVIVAIDRDRLDSGRAGTLNFTVTNGMGDAMRDAVLSVDTGASTTVQASGATDAQLLGDITPGASAAAAVSFLTSNGATGILKLPVRVAWQDANGTTQAQTYDFGIELLGTVDIQLSGVSSSVAATSTAVVTGTLTNLGNALAHNAYVSLVGGGGYAPTDQTYLGDINPNTALPFTLTTVAANATLLNGTGGGSRFPPGGQGGAGGAPGGGSGDGGAGPRGGGGFGNGTGGGGRFFRGGNQVAFLVQWNDDYGTQHTALLNATVRARAAAGAATATTSSSGAGARIPMPALAGALGAIVVGAVALAAWQRRRGGA